MSATSWGAVSCAAALASVDLVTPYTAPARVRVAAKTASPALLTVELMSIPLVRSRAPDAAASLVRTWRGVLPRARRMSIDALRRTCSPGRRRPRSSRFARDGRKPALHLSGTIDDLDCSTGGPSAATR